MMRLTNLEEFIGNNHIIKYIKESWDKSTHILFEGERGTGKTTFAYIIANMFANKESIRDVNCQHYSGVNEMRSLVENFMDKTSLFGSKKVIILDEVHSLSRQAERELLKPLEDEKYKNKLLIIGCTTSVDTLSPMFLDRFVRLKTHLLADKQALQVISRLETTGNFKLDKPKKVLIVEKSEGNPRLIINNTLKVKDLDDLDEVKYLLDLSSLEPEQDILEFFKILTYPKVTWSSVVENLTKLLRKHSPSNIRIGLINILAGKLRSQYLKGMEEGTKLLYLYDSLVENQFSIADKAALTAQLYTYFIKLKSND
jgi:DNA polymerase III gamma/tau subunit